MCVCVRVCARVRALVRCLCRHVGACLTWNLNFPSTVWKGEGRGVWEGKE